jgi:MerR family transcriptional regulator, light-induced transcriptional regulator
VFIMTHADFLDLSDSARMRSGTAARLAGLPVTTLRVWERRYAVVAAPKTATGQRLYSGADVQRLRMLKRLTDCGHAIGSVASLSAQALEALMAQEAAVTQATQAPASTLQATSLATSLASSLATPQAAAGNLRLWVVGQGAAQKLEGLAACELVAVHPDLEAAEGSAALAATDWASQPLDILLIHLPSLLAAEADRVAALAAQLGSPSVVVLYAFGRESLADTLRSAGVTVRRDPIAARELCTLVTSVASQKRPRSEAQAAVALPADMALTAFAQARQFDDASLSYLMNISTNVACECPRHVAEIVMQLASFERYSQDCLSRSPADADLHAHLTAVAASARTGFERALQRVMTAEGIVLPQRANAAL